MQLLARMLPELKRRGHKVLLFSQMTRMLDLLEDWCAAQGWGVARLDGSTRQHERQARIAHFSADPEQFVFLLSTRAGGLGINLTAADTVILYDSDWNPQMDLQAQDRAHRLGQTKPVCVFRLVTAQSVESRILAAAASKLKLERLVVIDRRQSLLGAAELQQLLAAELGDLRAGTGERPIGDAELAQLLDRDTLLKLAETRTQAQGFDWVEEAPTEF